MRKSFKIDKEYNEKKFCIGMLCLIDKKSVLNDKVIEIVRFPMFRTERQVNNFLSVFLSEDFKIEYKGNFELILYIIPKFYEEKREFINKIVRTSVLYRYITDFGNELGISGQLLSIHNLRYVRNRLDIFNKKHFLEKLFILEKYLYTKDISKKDVCIVNGTMLEACGIRFSGDIDIIVSSDTYKRLGDLGANADIEVDIKLCNDYLFKDDDIIYNKNLHFVLYGFKFINIELLFIKRLMKVRKKHNCDDVKRIIKYYCVNLF